MREIKLRAWDTVEDKYHYNSKLDNGDILVIHLHGRIEISDHETYRPEDFIIEQYTGLKDKTGKEIFEGDIIHIESDFNDDVFSIPVIFKEGCFLGEGSGLLEIICGINNPVIIGHIHEGNG